MFFFFKWANPDLIYLTTRPPPRPILKEVLQLHFNKVATKRTQFPCECLNLTIKRLGRDTDSAPMLIQISFY